MDNEASVIQAWKNNAKPWIEAVRNRGIRDKGVASRDALVSTIEDHAPVEGRVLDVGCGEGWLAHELSNRGFSVTGVDSSEELIEFAMKHRSGHFLVADQANLAELELGRFNLIVCNFSLFGESTVSRFIASVPGLLVHGGALIIQTLHPSSIYRNGRIESGWQNGTWAGLPGDFGEPPPTFVRSLENWSVLFETAGLRLQRLIEPPVREGSVASLIFVVSNGVSDDCAA